MFESMRNWLRTRRGSGLPASSGEAKWLAGYGGQTADELIDLADTYRIDSVVVALSQAIQAKAAEGKRLVTDAELTVLAVEAFERDVNNDGFDGFFRYSAQHVPNIVDALRAIDAQEVANIAASAIAALRISPELTEAKVEAVMSQVDEDRLDEALGDADSRFFALRVDLAPSVLNYVRANRDQIDLP